MLSVIIPVFNNERTIEATLRSIAEQSYADFECIIINDGSSDRTGEVVRAFIKNDERFSLISQQNSGVSSARNLGLEKASRKYVTFVDGDDLVPKDAFKMMHRIAVTNDADTIVGIYERVDGTDTHINTRSRKITEKALRIGPDDQDMLHTWTLCNKWLDRELIEKHKVRFEKLRHLEDGVFLYSYLKHAEKIYTCPHVVYKYIKPLPALGRTTTQQVDTNRLHDADNALKLLMSITEKYGDDFRCELLYRYMNAPLFSDYYRRIWRFAETDADELTARANTLFDQLDEKRKERLAMKHADLFSEDGTRILNRHEMAAEPRVTVILTDKQSPEGAAAMLESLYDQAEVSFSVLADSVFKDTEAEQYSGFENFAWTDAVSITSESSTMEAVVRSAYGRYVSIIDSDMIYNHGSLRAMVKTLDAEPASDRVNIRYALLSEEGIRDIENDEKLTCKLFRRDAAILETDLNYPSLRLKGPEMLALNEPEKTAASQSSGLIKSLRRLIKGFSSTSVHRRNAKTSKISSSGKIEKEKMSYQAECYFDLDIDKWSIVVEGLGKRPKGSSLYILRELMKPEYCNYKVYFPVTANTAEITDSILQREGMDRVITVEAGSKAYKKALFSAGYLFNEVDFPNWWIKKPGQVYCNLWHGTPLKMLGKKKTGYIHHDANAARNFTMADYLLFANDYSIDHILMDTDVGEITPAKGLMLGYPRTGELFNSEKRVTIRSLYDLDDVIVSIWMPTWNDASTDEDTNKFLQELDGLMTDRHMMFVNLHHKSKVVVDYEVLSHIKPFPQELDIYEFLTASDLLITDYSSIFFDYAACRKKIILHCPDIDEYSETRGLHMDLRDLPFPVTKTPEALFREMKSPKDYDDKDFFERFNKYDSERNTELLCRAVICGDTSNIEVRSFARIGSTKPVFLIADSFRTGRMTDLLYEMYRSGCWGNNWYLSFQEKVADVDVGNAYPLVRNVKIFATKGKALSERSERSRLYGVLDVKKYILIDPDGPERIRSIARFAEPVFLILTDRQLDQIKEGNKELLKAVKLFNRIGNGIFTLNEEHTEILAQTGISSCVLHNAKELAEAIEE